MKKLFVLLLLTLYSFFLLISSPQINIQGVIYEIDSLAHFKVGPGSIYTALNLKTGKKQLKVYFLAMDKDNPYLIFNSLVGRDSIVTGERISSAATRHSKPGEIYFAGTNGDFYETTGAYVGRTINGSLIKGEIARTPYATRPMATVDRLNNMYIDEMIYSGMVTYQTETYPIATVNDQRGTNELVLYNNYNGNYTHTNSYGAEALIELLPSNTWGVNKKLIAKVVRVVSDKGNMQIGKGQAVLSGHGDAKKFLQKMQPGDAVELNLKYVLNNNEEAPDIYGGVGGDRLILKNGLVTDNNWAENHPRTALGYNERQIIFCIVDGRSAYSDGVTTKQLGDIIKSAGATDAINLDGGGSSGMYIRQYGMMNNCSDGSERAVANGIFAICTAPEDNTIAEILAKQRRYLVPPYGVIDPTILGYNKYGLLINTDVKATLNCVPELGYINEDGAFVASGRQSGTLQVSLGELKTTIEIQKIESAPIAIRLDSVIVDSYKPYEIEVLGDIGNEKIGIYAAALNWQVEHPEVCSVNNGILTGKVNGITHVYGNLGDYYDTILVKVQIPDKREVPAIDFSDNWNITASSALKEFITRVDEDNSLIMNYKYSSGRLSNILLKNSSLIFGLPDTLRLAIDPGDALFSKITLSLNSNNEKSSKAFYIENPSPSVVSTIDVPVSMLSENSYDRNMYPIRLDFIQLYIAPTGNVIDKNYSPRLKEFSAIYKNIALSLNPAWLRSGIKAYPNPIINHELILDLPDEYGNDSKLHILGADGRMWLTRKLSSGINWIDLYGVPTGIYILNVTNGKLNESIKVLLK